MMCLLNDLTRALETLELLDASGRHDFLVQAALETGGLFKQTYPKQTWDNQRVEIKAHGVFAEGGDVSEAIRNWIRAASSQARIQGRVDQAEARLRLPLIDQSPEQTRADCRMILENGHEGAVLRAARTTLAQMGAQI